MHEVSVSLPLDDDGALRRACPYCEKEFKIIFDRSELKSMIEKEIGSFLTDSDESEDKIEESEDSGKEMWCPYCGQKAFSNAWWTHEQLKYFEVFAKNMLAEIINEGFIREMRRNFSGNSFVKFEGKELGTEEPWISPENNDMKLFELPCCNRKIKVEDDYSGEIYCTFCGFPHKTA